MTDQPSGIPLTDDDAPALLTVDGNRQQAAAAVDA